MITKKTLSFTLIALCVAANAQAMLRNQKAKKTTNPKPSLLRRTTTLPFRAAWGTTKVASRFMFSKPILAITALASYPVLQKTFFADSPLVDIKALANYAANKWENNFSKAQVNAKKLYNYSSEKAVDWLTNSKQWCNNSWTTTSGVVQNMYNSDAVQKGIDLATKTQSKVNQIDPAKIQRNFTAWTNQTTLDPEVSSQMTDSGASDWEL